MKRLWVGGAILGITLLTFFQFPGHTWLGSDTQIYMPILEHMRDPTVLQKDLIAQHPHVAYTLYDEVALGLRKVTGLDLRHVLQSEQIVCRALGIWGVYLIATALGLSDFLALPVAAVFSLGATITGPAVLAVMRQKRTALWALAAAAVILLLASRYEATSANAQPFFSRLDPHQEELQRMRASYNWISIWWRDRLPNYLILYAATVLAYCRVRNDVPRALRFFLIGLPLIGVASVPASYLLLEKMR